jgi:Zn-dependent M16 (insulinase) family peptidase
VVAQEGWHLELDDPSDPLTYKGVVFNEMKGVYSSPDSMFYRSVQQVCVQGAEGGGYPCPSVQV